MYRQVGQEKYHRTNLLFLKETVINKDNKEISVLNKDIVKIMYALVEEDE